MENEISQKKQDLMSSYNTEEISSNFLLDKLHTKVDGHRKTARQHEYTYRSVMLLNVFTTMGAGLCALQGWPWIAVSLCSFVAFSTASCVVYNYMEKCVKHRCQSFRFKELVKRIVNKKVSDEELEALHREIIEIEQDDYDT